MWSKAGAGGTGWREEDALCNEPEGPRGASRQRALTQGATEMGEDLVEASGARLDDTAVADVLGESAGAEATWACSSVTMPCAASEADEGAAVPSHLPPPLPLHFLSPILCFCRHTLHT